MAERARKKQTHVRRRYRPIAGTTYDAFTPRSVSGLELWLDCQTELRFGQGYADAAAIGTLTDWSDNGYHATQAVAGAKPTFKTNIINGRPVARFDGTSDFLTSTEPSDTKPFSLFFVLSMANLDAVQTVMGSSLDTSGYELRIINTSGLTRLTAIDIADAANSTTSVPAATWHINGITLSGAGAVAYYLNGATRGTGTLTNTPGAGQTRVIGRRDPIGLQYFVGDVAEVIIYNSVLSAANHNTVGKYLSYKYGIAWTTVV